MLGSVDSNTGSPDLGWDTDQFPMDVKGATMVMKVKPSKYNVMHPLKVHADNDFNANLNIWKPMRSS